MIPRCAVAGALCAGTLGATAVVISVPSEYSPGDVLQAMMFGIGEALLLAGAAGAFAGLLIGLLAYLMRAVKRRLF